MRTALVCAVLAAALFAGSGCSFFREQEKQRREAYQRYIEDQRCRKFEADFQRQKPVMENTELPTEERWAAAKSLLDACDEAVCRRLPARAAELKQIAGRISQVREAELKRLALAFRKLAADSSQNDAEDNLADCREILKPLQTLQDVQGYAKLRGDVDRYLTALFRNGGIKLLLSAEKEYRDVPSPVNRDILRTALEHFGGKKVRRQYYQIRKNFEQVKNTEQKFARFKILGTVEAWNAFKSQARRIGYPENEPAKRRFTDYIRGVENCRSIIFKLKSWEFIGSSFFEWGKCDFDLKIWSASQSKPHRNQIEVEDATGNWYADRSKPSHGKVKSTSFAVSEPNNGILRQVNIQFQNSDGRTVQSPVIELPIWKLAAQTADKGYGELKVSTYPVNRFRGKPGVVVFELRDMPKLETYSD